MANLQKVDLTELNSVSESGPISNYSTIGVSITGTWVGTITFEASVDGINYVPVPAVILGTKSFVTETTTNGQFLVNASGLVAWRAKMTSYTSGTASIEITGNNAPAITTAFGEESRVSTVNSSTTLLDGATEFTGTFEDLLGYSNISVIANSDVDSGEPGLIVEWSSDGTNVDLQDTQSVPANGKEYSYRVKARYVRVRFVNGPTNQSSFRLQTILHIRNRDLDDSLNVINNGGGGATSGSEKRTIFDNLPVAHAMDQISIEFTDFTPEKILDVTTLNGGSIDSNNPQLDVISGTNVNGLSRVQSKIPVNYMPGHETRVDFTASFSGTASNASSRIGIFNDDEGFWIGYQNGVFGIARRTGGVDSFVAQSSFNGDKLDGALDSAFTRDNNAEALNTLLVNVFRISFGWLGASVIKFSIITPDGNYVTFHTIKYPNSSTTPSIVTPKLPMRAEVVKSASDATNLRLTTSSWRGGNYGGGNYNKDGRLKVEIPSEVTGKNALSARSLTFGALDTRSRFSDIAAQFATSIPSNLFTSEVTGSGSVGHANAKAFLSSGTTAGSSAKFYSRDIVRYRPGNELYFLFTARFPVAGSTGDRANLGLWDDTNTNGCWLGMKDGNFGIGVTKNGTETFVAQSQFSEDTLTGIFNSKFTKDGNPVALDPTKLYVFEIVVGWLGVANIDYRIMSPDGHWVLFHSEKRAGTDTEPYTFNPSLPLAALVENTTTADMQIESSSISAGYFGAFRDAIISQGNSSSTPLGADAVFTGEAVEILNFSQINITYRADQNSAAGGVEFQYSTDGDNWYNATPNFNYEVGALRTFQLGVYSRFFRVRYTNGSIAQTEFDLQTMLLPTESRLSIHRVNSPINDDRSVELTKAIITGRQPDGDYVNNKADGGAYTYSTLDGDTALLAGEELLSDWMGTDGWKSIELWIDSDVPSAEGGLEIQYTLDSNVATPVVSGSPDVFSFNASDVTAGKRVIRISPRLDGFRIRYTNGASAQTSFTLQATLHTAATDLPRVETSRDLVASNEAVITKGTVSAPNNSQQYSTIGRDGEGGSSLNVHVTDFQAGADVDIKALDNFKTGQLNINGQTATLIPGSTLVENKTLSITNTDFDIPIYWGNSSVNRLTGDIIFERSSKELDLNNTNGVYIISDSEQDTVNINDISANTLDSNTGVTNPTNMYSSNDTRAVLDTIGDTAEISGFDGSGTITQSVSNVKIKLEARKTPGAASETTSHSASVIAESGSSTTVISPTVTADPDLLYIVFVARRNTVADVINVTSTMGFSGYEIIDDANNISESRITAIRMLGTATLDGTISVTFDAATDHDVISVSSFANVNETAILSSDDNANAAASSLSGSVVGTQNGLVVLGSAGEVATPISYGAGYTERAIATDSGNNNQSMSVATSPIASTGAKAWSVNYDTSGDISAIAIALEPADSANPVVRVNYEVSGVVGATSMEVAVTEESDGVYKQEITTDRVWTETDIDNTSLIVELLEVGNADLEIDALVLEVTDAGSNVRVTYAWIGNDS